MTKLNCPSCKRRRKFNEKEKNKFECTSCDKVFKQCRVDNCTNIVGTGFVCKECIGKGIKNGGSLAFSTALAVGGVAYKVLRKR